jgi:hypothetical protein
MLYEYTKTEILPPERRGAPVEIKILTSPNKHAFLSLPDIGALERILQNPFAVPYTPVT